MPARTRYRIHSSPVVFETTSTQLAEEATQRGDTVTAVTEADA